MEIHCVSAEATRDEWVAVKIDCYFKIPKDVINFHGVAVNGYFYYLKVLDKHKV